jgi:hypothetical protein
METMLQKVADGSARGIVKWYSVAHAARCTRCGTFLDRMKATLEALKASKASVVPDDVRERLLSGKWRDVSREE